MPWRLFLLIWAVGAVGTVQTEICYMGNEPDWSGKMRWVLPYRDPCSCSEIRPGGVNMQAPKRSFLPRYLDSPVIMDDPEEIKKLLKCPLPVRKIACENSDLSISCSSSGVIDVQWALYGRERGSNDCMQGYESDKAVPCGKETSSLSKVQGECQGKQSCTISVTNNYFSEPCQGIPKYLVVRYVCK